MSVRSERGPLDTPTSLHDHALRLLGQTPEGPLPDFGAPFPDEARRRRDRAPGKTSNDRLRTTLCAHFADPSRSAAHLYEALVAVDLPPYATPALVEHITAGHVYRARDAGAYLVTTGHDRRLVSVGLALLAVAGTAEDARAVRTVGVLGCLARQAVDTLAGLPGAAPDLVWLAARLADGARARALEALAAHGDDPAVRAALLRTPLDFRRMSPAAVARVAEAADAVGALRADAVEASLVDQAMRMLAAITRVSDFRSEIIAFRTATELFRRVADTAGTLDPSIERYALLLGLAQELHSGHARLLDWPPGEREAVHGRFREVLGWPAWAASVAGARASDDAVERHRADWIRRTTGPSAGESRPFSIDVAVPDPAFGTAVETRILVDGHPVVAAAFDSGPAYGPDVLLEQGLLRAGEEPREVRLAEAACTEGCCGALYVTIERDGDVVRWGRWRRPGQSADEPPLPEFPDLAFDASLYDAEVSRAEGDVSWQWPAHELARLLRAGLRAKPDIAARWHCTVPAVWTHYLDRDQVDVVVNLKGPPLEGEGREALLQFIWSLRDDGTPPVQQAAAALRRLGTENPTAYARLSGGDAASAAVLGFPWPPVQ